VFAPRFGLDKPANFEGHWHLYVAASLEDLGRQAGRPSGEVDVLLSAARAKLLALRAPRVRPARDEKVLTSWNALMIRGMAIAARALGQDELGESAGRALDFIRGTLWRDGRLLATSMAGRAHLNAYLDDYVYLVDAVLELQQLRFAGDELEFARQLLEAVLEHFPDREAGGFFFTSADHEALIHRSKVFGDDATPSGNGIAARVLLRMGHLLGEPRYLTAAERTLRAAWPALGEHPQAHVALLDALEELLHPPEIVILRGAAPAIEGWRRELARPFAPRRLVLAILADAPDLPRALADKAPRAGRSAMSAAAAPAPHRWTPWRRCSPSCVRTACRHERDSGQQLDVAADGGGVDGERALGGEAQQVMRPSGLGSGAREALAAEWLHPDHRTDHVAVHVRVAHRQRAEHVPGNALEAAVNPRVSPKPVLRIASSTCASSPLR